MLRLHLLGCCRLAVVEDGEGIVARRGCWQESAPARQVGKLAWVVPDDQITRLEATKRRS